MTFRAVLDDGKEHKPVLRLMTGEMTPRQIDKEYSGAIGKCPDCEGMLASTDLAGGGTLAAAIADKDRRVKYRRGVYAGGTDELLSQMHFKHAAGYLQNGLAPCNCKSRNQLIHTEAVEAIAHQYRKDSPQGFKVDAECQFVRPGTPPEMYRPDIVVHNRFGGKHTCIEYQRSPEPFDKFVHRHELRGSEWGSVIWFFDDKIWDRKSTCEARDWLFDNGQTFYRCWVDEATLQLQVEEGTFATAVVKTPGKKRLRKFVPKPCAPADIINEYLISTGQETDRRQERLRVEPEQIRADRLQGFNLVEKSETDRAKNRELFQTLRRQKTEREEDERRRREWHTKMLRIEAEEREQQRVAAEKRHQLLYEQQRRVEMQSFILQHLGTNQLLKQGLITDQDQISYEFGDTDICVRASDEQLEQLYKKASEAKVVNDAKAAEEGAKRKAEHQRLEAVQREEERIAQELQEAAAAERQREDNRNRMISSLASQGEDPNWLKSKSDDFLDKLEDKYLARIALQQAEDEEKERQLAAIRESKRLKAIAEHQQEELQWRPIEFAGHLGRHGLQATNLFVGDQIRPGQGQRWEIYKGWSNAGYSTHVHTHRSLKGWQVRKEGNHRRRAL